MPQENVMNYFKAIETDTDLREKVAAQLKDYTHTDEESAMKKMAEVASENGYVFSVDDMRSAADQQEEGELTDLMLEQVAGGLAVGCIVAGGDEYHGYICFLIGVGF